MSEMMPDHEGMDTELIAALFGVAIDPRELIAKMGPDQSELHVNKPLTIKTKKRERKVAAAGLAGNTVAAVGGGHALYMASKDERLPKFMRIPKKKQGLHALPKVSKMGKTGKVGALAAAGWVGLHSAELASDAIANRSLRRDLKRHKVSKKFVAQNLRPAGTTPAPQLNQVNSLFKPLKNGALTPLKQNPVQGMKPMRTLKPAAPGASGGTTGPLKPKAPMMPKPPAMAQPIKPKSPVAKSINEVVWETEIAKVDTDKHQVFGWATVTHVDGEEVIDLQDDYIPTEEIEKAAYNYVLSSRKGGDMHTRDGDKPLHTADLIESVIFSPEKIQKMGLDPGAFPKMGWWLGMKVNDEQQWELVKKGDRTGFSIHGKGTRVSKEIGD